MNLDVQLAKDSLNKIGVVWDFMDMAKDGTIFFWYPHGWPKHLGLMVDVDGPRWEFGFPMTEGVFVVDITTPNYLNVIITAANKYYEKEISKSSPLWGVTHEPLLQQHMPQKFSEDPPKTMTNPEITIGFKKFKESTKKDLGNTSVN